MKYFYIALTNPITISSEFSFSIICGEPKDIIKLTSANEKSLIFIIFEVADDPIFFTWSQENIVLTLRSARFQKFNFLRNEFF